MKTITNSNQRYIYMPLTFVGGVGCVCGGGGGGRGVGGGVRGEGLMGDFNPLKLHLN